jgi:hypothetical protein
LTKRKYDERALRKPALNPEVIRSIQAVAIYALEIDPNQAPPSPFDCRVLFEWIINDLAMTYDNGFVADDPNGRTSAFADGRQFVGQEISKAVQVRPELFRKKSE